MLRTSLSDALLDQGEKCSISHDAALANLPWLQLKLGFDQHQQDSPCFEPRQDCRQHQGERDEGQVARQQVKAA